MSFTHELKLGAAIGDGGFGDVYRGTDPVHGTVAVKILRQDARETPAEWATRSEELVQEAQRLESAAHANVVRVLGVVRDGTTSVVHMVTEFCNGGSLFKDFQNGPMRLGDLRRDLTNVAAGLAQIHSRQMIHRDIKPGNILRHKGICKVGDFGLVTDKLILGYASEQGYLDHLAPEVHRDGVTSFATDIWALGMTAYRLLHGQAFYDSAFAGADIPTRIMDGGFATRLGWLPHVPEAWRRLVRRCMHDDPHRRFRGCHQLSQAIGGLPVHADWECKIAADCVTWKTPSAGRTVVVTRKLHSPRRHEWWVERNGGGKRRVQISGAAGVIVNARQADDGLTTFFAKWLASAKS